MPATQHKPCIRCHACGKKHWDQKRADQCRGKAIRKAQRAGYLQPQPVGGVYLSPPQQQQQMYWQQQSQMALPQQPDMYMQQQQPHVYLPQQPQLFMPQQPHIAMQQQPQMYMPQQQQQPQQVQQQQPQQQQQLGNIFYNDGFGLPSFQPYSPQESHHGQSPMLQIQQQQQLDMQQLQQQQMSELFGFDLPLESLVDPSLIPQTPPPTPPAAVAAATAAQPHPPQQPHQQVSHDPTVEASLMQFIESLDDAEVARSIAMLDEWQAGNAVAGNLAVDGLGYDGQV